MPGISFPRKRKYVSSETNTKYKKSKTSKPVLSRFNLATSLVTGKERKWSDTQINQVNNVTYTIAGSAPFDNTIVGSIATGTDYTNRVGRLILVKSIQLKLFLRCAQPNAPSNNIDSIRVMLWVDKETNGSDTTVGNVLSLAGSVMDVTALRNMTYHDQFQVLMDQVVALSAAGPGGIMFEKYLKVNIPCRYLSTGNSVPDTNNIHLAIFSTSGSLDTYKCSATGYARVMFEDN